MTTDLTVDLDKATTYAEDLPDHTGQLSRYTAAGLAERVAWSLEARAAKIITIGRRGILEMGQELLQAREEASHGTWTAFLGRCGIQERTAQNYMHVAEQFGDKPEIISALPSTSLYALAAPNADPIVVQEIIAEVLAGAPVPNTVQVKERLAPAAPVADGAPHLPPDFAQAQSRAKKRGLYISMNTGGRFALTYETGVRAVAGSGLSWPGALELLTTLEAQALAPPPTQTRLPDAGDEEIAAAVVAPPPPLTLTPLPLALPGLIHASGSEARKLLVSKRMLLQATLHLIEAELERTPGPLISFPGERALDAARLFVASQALNGAAAMLAFSAVVESEEVAA